MSRRRSSGLGSRWVAAALVLPLAAIGLTVSATTGPAEAAAAPAFDCIEPGFFAQAEEPVGTGQLFAGSYTEQGQSQWNAIGGTVTNPLLYNALAFNPTDEYLYGTIYGGGQDGKFVRVNRSGVVANIGDASPALGAAPNLLWDAGEFGPDGTYYVANGYAGTQRIYTISGLANASTVTPVRSFITLSSSITFADLAYKDGYLWAHSYGGNNNFHRIALDGTVTSFSSNAIPVMNYGSAFTMTNGNLAFVGTNNLMYQVSVSDPVNPQFELVSTVSAPTNQRSDATNCATAQQASLSVTKTGPETVVMGEAIEWTVTVTNDGPGISSGFVAIDTLPGGVTLAGATSDDSNCVLASGLITCNGGRLAVNETAVITVTATAPLTVGTIVNTVRVVGNEDSTPSSSTPAETEVTLGTNAGGGDTAELNLGAGESDAAVTDGANGTVVNTGGNLVYTPDPDFSGVDSFTYTPDGGSAVTVYVTVVPKAQPDAVTTAINSDIDGTVAANDRGVNLQFSNASDPANGSVVLAGDGTFTYTPDSSFLGTDIFTYVVTGDGGSATGTVTVTVVAAPVAVTDAITTSANTAADDIDVLANDSGLGLSAELLAAPAIGTVVDNGDSTFDYTPPADFSGSASFTYTLTGDGGTTTGTVNITVTPVAVDDLVTTSAGTAAADAVITNDAGTNATTIVGVDPTHGDLSLAADGSFTYTPDAGYSGPDQFTYVLTADGGSSTGTVNVTVSPAAPDDTATTSVGQATVIDVLANDTGTGLTIDSHSAAGHGTAAVASGTLRYTPGAGYSGIDTFSYVARDTSGSVVTATVTVRVLPAAVPDAISTPAASAVAISVVGNDQGTALAVTATSTSAHGAVAINVDGTVTYSPDAGYSGFDSFDYTVTDASGLTATATVSVTVTPASAPDAQVIARGGTVRVNLLGNDIGTGLYVSSVTQPSNGSLTLNPDGTVTYIPDAGFTGADTFTYTVTDAAGSSVSSAVTITVELPTLAKLPVTGAPVNGLLQTATLMVLVGAALLVVRPRRARRHRA